MDNADKALSIRSVDISYGARAVIKELSLDVAEGECFGLIGLNGTGKTTLIKAILALRDHDKGDILVFGQASKLSSGRRRLAYLPERFDPPWFLNGEEFLAFSLKLYGRVCDPDRVGEMADKLALERGALKNRVQTYSKGMRQKLGLMATLLTECPLLVLDEPMSGLDPLARACVKEALLEAKAAGSTVFLSSHILADMDEMCNRVGVLSNGCLVFTGTPEALKKRGGDESVERAFLRIIGREFPAQAA